MRAARDFAARLRASGMLPQVGRVTCVLYGSLGATGIGHGTPDAIVAGLQGLAPETADPDAVRSAWRDWPEGGSLSLDGEHAVPFAKTDIVFEPRTRLPGHPNAMTLDAWRRGAAVEDAGCTAGVRTGTAPREPTDPPVERAVALARRTTRSAAASSGGRARTRRSPPTRTPTPTPTPSR